MSNATVKKSILFCLCAALLMTPLLTACDLFAEQATQDTQNIQDAVTDPVPVPKECDHEPYSIQTRDGVAMVCFDPCYTKPFVLEIPETDGEGNPITVIQAASRTAMMPTVMTEEDFAVFQGKLEAYYGLTYEEAKEVANNSKHPKYKEGFYLFKQLVYYRLLSLNNCKNDQEKAALLESYPITEKMDVYVMDPTVTSGELFGIYDVARKAAPELDDVWYREACAHTELDYPSGLGETMTEIRWPSQLSEIKELSFVGCGGLQTVTVPGTVKTVGEGAFAFCDALEEITFSEGVTKLSYYTLAYCTQLKTVNLPASLESIEFIFDDAMIAKNSERELPVIHYAGTMEQWEALFTFDSYFAGYGGFGCMDIHCSDGVIQATLDRN